ncbi:uncharacterized protein SETTUDRAFT_30617 [Exserohilum turcica Et28A]|uniref:Uncharacterized protein n=1 Tax=Exserohilum turcicum (strain 28A) TaxID=671987 RepID=R0J647_EXST2|nr:uncharacterized protein SETTUDRAFT_30617 [Exserohilum turcica Et28A]EOA92146.1 hypothetical protein SETTUDRAFT_30617 [Exserohilum turcica Et28A]
MPPFALFAATGKTALSAARWRWRGPLNRDMGPWDPFNLLTLCTRPIQPRPDFGAQHQRPWAYVIARGKRRKKEAPPATTLPLDSTPDAVLIILTLRASSLGLLACEGIVPVSVLYVSLLSCPYSDAEYHVCPNNTRIRAPSFQLAVCAAGRNGDLDVSGLHGKAQEISRARHHAKSHPGPEIQPW